MSARLLDLFCGAGGAAWGLHQAFPDADITGVDIRPQKNYPFRHVVADAMEFPLDGYDFIWASPPCQQYTPLRAVHRKAYPDLVAATRERLISAGVPWIIENVPQAPLHHGIVLCGGMFGLRTYRHRRFETSWLMFQPFHPRHVIRTTSAKRLSAWLEGQHVTVTGNIARYMGDEAMGITWMTGDELSQAIPPAYSRYLAQFIPLGARR